MNDYIAEITLDINCERSCQTIMLTQFDKGKKIHLTDCHGKRRALLRKRLLGCDEGSKFRRQQSRR